MISNQLRLTRVKMTGRLRQARLSRRRCHVYKYISCLLQTFSLRGLRRGRTLARQSEIDNSRVVGAGRGTLVGQFKRLRADRMMTVIT